MTTLVATKIRAQALGARVGGERYTRSDIAYFLPLASVSS